MKDKLLKFYHEHTEFVNGVAIGTAIASVVAVMIHNEIIDGYEITAGERFTRNDGKIEIMALKYKNGKEKILTRTPPE